MAKIKTGIEKLSAATKELKKKITEGVTVDTLGYLLDEFKDAEATLKAEAEGEEEIVKGKPEIRTPPVDNKLANTADALKLGTTNKAAAEDTGNKLGKV